MEKYRSVILLLVMTAAVTLTTALPCSANERKEDDKTIFTEPEPRGRRPWHWRIELTEEEIGRILESLKKEDPKAAKEVVKLRQQAPEKFIEELRRNGGEEYEKIVQEHSERARQQRRADFFDWLEKNYRRESRELASVKDRDPNLYEKRLDYFMREKYAPIREAERSNPELAVVLKEDLLLKERRDVLIMKIAAAKNERDKQRLVAQLESVLGERYDLILRRKQIEYERLLRWVEGLQNRIKRSRAEIAEAKKEEVKAENIKERMKTLLEGKKKFQWGD